MCDFARSWSFPSRLSGIGGDVAKLQRRAFNGPFQISENSVPHVALDHGLIEEVMTLLVRLAALTDRRCSRVAGKQTQAVSQHAVRYLIVTRW